jgi:PAS domain S-box-containing protein
MRVIAPINAREPVAELVTFSLLEPGHARLALGAMLGDQSFPFREENEVRIGLNFLKCNYLRRKCIHIDPPRKQDCGNRLSAQIATFLSNFFWDEALKENMCAANRFSLQSFLISFLHGSNVRFGLKEISGGRGLELMARRAIFGRSCGVGSRRSQIVRPGSDCPAAHGNQTQKINKMPRLLAPAPELPDAPAEKTMSRIALWLANTLNCVADGLLATNCCGEVLFMNSRAEQLTGWRIEDAMRESSSRVFNVVKPKCGTRLESPLREAYVEEEVRRGNNCHLVAAAGERIPIEFSAAPIRTEEGEVVGAVVVFRERKRGAS